MKVLLDTSGWLFALAGKPGFAEVLETAEQLIVPGLVLSEMDYHLRKRRKAMWRVLADLDGGVYRYEPPTPDDLARAVEIDRKFSSLDLGLVDASIVSLAERLELPKVLTADSDFSAVRFGPRWERALELVVAPGRRG